MKSSRPVLHARDHMLGGADPILPALAAGGPIDGYLNMSATLEYWYRLGEPGPWPTATMSVPNFALDSSGHNYHLTAWNRNQDGTGVNDGSYPLPSCHIAGALTAPDEDGAIQFNLNEYQWTVWGYKMALSSTVALPIETAFPTGGDAVGDGSTFAAWLAYQPLSVPPDKLAPFTPPDYADVSARPLISTWSRTFGVGNYGVRIGFKPSDGHLWYKVGAANSVTPFEWDSGFGLVPGEWNHFAFVIAKTDVDTYERRVYLNANKLVELTGTAVDVGVARPGVHLSIGGGNEDDLRWAHGRGGADEVAYWSGPLTDSEISQIYQSGRGGTDGGGGGGNGDGGGGGVVMPGGPGSVLTVGDDGSVTWQPPTTVVEHGGGTPDEVPSIGDSSAFAGTPTSPSGWHIQAHVEQVVLYDSNPGRFDVPSRKWTRVPFDTVRIQRQWEPVVDGPDLKSAWLPDDRGLTDQAKNGILHITAEIAADTDLSVFSWPWSFEWPAVDWQQLPNFGDPAGADPYVRAARIVDLSHGVVLRASPGSTLRRFFEWQFPDPADATPDWVDYDGTDNPYPIYPADPDRPLSLPQPYPKMSDAHTGQYYAPQKTFGMDSYTLAAGDNLCVQAWQDSPWTLRFSTDKYRDPYPSLQPAWRRWPHLTVGFYYDPESIDHTTGKLL